MFRAILILSVLTFAAFCGESPEELKKAGMQALFDSQTHPEAVVKAAECFAKASELFVLAGNDTEAQESNSYLYWCKKKMNMQEIEAFRHNAPAVPEPAPVVADPETEAKTFFQRADTFAKLHARDHLLVAIRYFEVADRFTGTETGMKAQRLSLQEMQLAVTIKPVVTTKPSVTGAVSKGVGEVTSKALPTPSELSALASNKDQAIELVKRVAANPESWTEGDFNARWLTVKEIGRISGNWFTIYHGDVQPCKVSESNSILRSNQLKAIFDNFQYAWIVGAATKEDLVARKAKKPGGDCFQLLREYTDTHAIDFSDKASRQALCDWLDEHKSGIDTAQFRGYLDHSHRFGGR